MTQQSGIEQLIARDRLIVSVAMLVILSDCSCVHSDGSWHVNVLSANLR